ncbi:MAG: glycosyltransferase family 4 protein [bacterium]
MDAVASAANRGARHEIPIEGPGVTLHLFDIDLPKFGDPSLGWHLFETDALKTAPVSRLRNLDGILVCSKWAAAVLHSMGFAPQAVHVVPGGVDTDLFMPHRSSDTDRFVFLNIGMWQRRKSQDILVDAFLEAFPKGTDAVLKFLTNWSPYRTSDTYEEIKTHVLARAGDRIEFLPYIKHYSDLPALFSQVDCGVFPYRGEGWCMPLIEMMACGKPAIATYHSGPTEYLNEDNAYLLHPSGYEYAFDIPHFLGEGRWATIHKGDLVDLLRHAYQQGRRTNHAGIETAKKFSWKNSARRLMEVVENFPVCSEVCGVQLRR